MPSFARVDANEHLYNDASANLRRATSYFYERTETDHATFLEIARDNGNLELVRPIDQDSAAEGRFQEATGKSFPDFRGGKGDRARAG